LEHRGRPVFNLHQFNTRGPDGSPTRVGRFLERLELHRLPELWNLLKGDLRLVGVKPLSLEEAKQLEEEWQQRHNDFFPGLTGAWFIETDRECDLNEVLTADVIYVATRDRRQDIRILLKTPRAWLRRIAHQQNLSRYLLKNR
jgi:lipopolysaccharide/colanic/teichoic acid biosynthesis glycosyltransferase